MRKMLRYYFFIVFVFLLGNVKAQTIENEEGELINTEERLLAINQLQIENSQISRANNMATNNNVFIQQIGNNNTIFSNVNAVSSNLNLVQNGEDNLIDIDETSREIQKFVTQTGNNNTVIDYSFNPEASTNLELLQEGNNLYFERFGTNELSKNLKFNMTGNARSIIVRSF